MFRRNWRATVILILTVLICDLYCACNTLQLKATTSCRKSVEFGDHKFTEEVGAKYLPSSHQLADLDKSPLLHCVFSRSLATGRLKASLVRLVSGDNHVVGSRGGIYATSGIDMPVWFCCHRLSKRGANRKLHQGDLYAHHRQHRIVLVQQKEYREAAAFLLSLAQVGTVMWIQWNMLHHFGFTLCAVCYCCTDSIIVHLCVLLPVTAGVCCCVNAADNPDWFVVWNREQNATGSCAETVDTSRG